jgi:hypothetical protein
LIDSANEMTAGAKRDKKINKAINPTPTVKIAE